MNEPTLALSNGQLAMAVTLLLLPALASSLLHLGLGRQILWAATRTTVQLLAVGFILDRVFALERPALVALIAALMLLAAALTAVSRTNKRYRRMYLDVFLSMSLASLVALSIGTALIIQNRPWWAPRYLIPILGMLLGNGMNGISLGLGVWLESVRERRGRIESLLALGATRWEAAQESVAEAVRRGLVPILNAMAVAGIVSLPGMMTGQILAGNPPVLAVRYQIVIMFLIGATVAMGTLSVVFLAYRRLFDDQHRLRVDRLRSAKVSPLEQP